MADEILHVKRVVEHGQITGYVCANPECGNFIWRGFGREQVSYKAVLCHMSTIHPEWWNANWSRVRIQEPGSDKWITRHYVSGKGDQSDG